MEFRRQLKKEYESATGNRFTAMLRFLLNPAAKWNADRDRSIDFFESLTTCETLSSDYVCQSGEALSENVKVSVLLEHSSNPTTRSFGKPPTTRKSTS